MKSRFSLIVTLFILIGVVLGIILSSKTKVNNQQISEMKLTSPVFYNDQKIPAKYTCQGDGINPPLEISEVPEGTQSIALVLKDPDAPSGPFIHWVLWNIPPNTKSIGENTTPPEATMGVNSVGKNFFFSPCPPQGQHHYVFYLYALDTTFTLPPEAGYSELEQLMAGHMVGATTLTGIFP